MDEFDVIVIGAGAAGVSAVRRLSAEGRPLCVLERRRRFGGRAWTWRDPSGFPLDLGCGWLHSADENELSILATEMGYAIDKTPPPWLSQLSAIEAPSEELAERGKAIGEFFRRLDEAGASETDQAADRLLELGCRWNPLINAISTYINGVELDRLSVKDFWRYRDTGVNWRVAEGYGTLIAALGTGPNIVFDCAVTLIDFTSAVVRIETPRGDLRAREGEHRRREEERQPRVEQVEVPHDEEVGTRRERHERREGRTGSEQRPCPRESQRQAAEREPERPEARAAEIRPARNAGCPKQPGPAARLRR